MSQSDLTEHAATLCTTCGLCCNGTWFSFVPLDTDEQKEHFAEAVNNDGDKMLLPCIYHSTITGCQIYPNRPNICRKYQCLLLWRLLKGETTLEDAVKIVTMTKSQRAKVIEAIEANAAFLESTPLIVQFTQIYLDNSKLPTSDEKENAELFLAYMSLLHLIRRYFFPGYREDAVQGVVIGHSEKDS